MAAVAVNEPAVGVGGAIAPADVERMRALIEDGELDAALDIGIAGLDAAGLVSAARAHRRDGHVVADRGRPPQTTALVTDGPFALVRTPIFAAMIRRRSASRCWLPTSRR